MEASERQPDMVLLSTLATALTSKRAAQKEAINLDEIYYPIAWFKRGSEWYLGVILKTHGNAAHVVYGYDEGRKWARSWMTISPDEIELQPLEMQISPYATRLRQLALSAVAAMGMQS